MRNSSNGMDHAYFKDRLSALFDNELPPQEKQIVEEHLHGCVECQELMTRLRQLDEAVTRHSQLADTDYWEKSAQKIEQRLGFPEQTVVTPIGRRWYEKGMGWKMVAAAASIAVLAYIGINSDKILKREDLQPRPTMQAPSVTPLEPKRKAVADTETNIEGEKDSAVASKLVEPKGVIDKQDYLDLQKLKKQPATVLKTPPGPQDASTADKEVIRDQTVDLPLSNESVQTNQYSAGRTAPAPGSLSERATKAAPVPVTDSAGADIRDEVREDALAQIDSVASDSTLTFWRKKRDALVTVQKTIPEVFGMLERKAAAPTSLKATEKTETKADTSEPKLSQQETEKQLLEAWYNIARLTKDKSERDDAVAGIRKVAENRRSANRTLAVRYLQELEER